MIGFHTRHDRWIGLGLAASLAGLTGCPDRSLTEVTPDPSNEVRTEFPIAVNRNLDILFVVDNSLSMLNEQDALAAKFQLMMDQLTSAQYGVPNLHIGVVSSNLGVGPYHVQPGLGTCGEDGDGAILQNTPRPLAGETEPSCTGPSDRFIIDVEDDAGERVRNYDGTLQEAFACIARLGSGGCGFEQQLEAMRRALDDSVPENAGFLRKDARLAVVFITDEDDCSAMTNDLFDLTRADIGATSDFRCFTHGATCAGQSVTELGEYQDCVAAAGSPYLHDVGEYVDFLRSLKKYPAQDLIVAGIVGANTDTIVVGDDPKLPGEQPKVLQSCFATTDPPDTDGAFPPVRLRPLFEAFGSNGIQEDICSDLTDALSRIGEIIGPPPEGACVSSTLVDQDDSTAGLQADCVVAEVRNPGTSEQSERLFGLCDDATDPAASSTLPCYTLTELPDKCGATTPYWVQVYYAPDDVVPSGTELSVRCLAR
jgi:hypothetical protein